MMSSSSRAIKKSARAFAVLEYVILIVIMTAAFFAFRIYAQRGMQGQYRKAGESFGFMRQYNPGASRECVTETDNMGRTVDYSRACYSNMVRRLGCKDKAGTHPDLNVSYYELCLSAAKCCCWKGCEAEPCVTDPNSAMCNPGGNTN